MSYENGLYWIFLKTIYPFIYFRRKYWPHNIFHNNIVTCFYIYSCCLCKLEDNSPPIVIMACSIIYPLI
jgi:hypothetical protein